MSDRTVRRLRSPPDIEIVEYGSGNADTAVTPFLKMACSEDRDPEHSDERATTFPALRAIVATLRRLIHVHGSQAVLVVLVLFAVAPSNISAAMALVVAVASAVPILPHHSAPFIVLILSTYVTLVTLLRLLYMNNWIATNVQHWFTNDHLRPIGYVCHNESASANSSAWVVTRSFEDWIGLPSDKDVVMHVAKFLEALIVFLFHAFVVYGHRDSSNKPVFPGFVPSKWDESIVDTFKFLVDFGFYKFGVEIALCAMSVVVYRRMDAHAILLTIWMLLLVQMPRRILKFVWPLLVFYQIGAVLLHYAAVLGLPEALCIQYPWHDWEWNAIYGDRHANLMRLLGLPDYENASLKSDGNFVLDEFILLVLFASQLKVFFCQESPRHPAGDNDSVYVSERGYLFVIDNPHHNFVEKQRNVVDVLKVCVFVYGHWISLVAVFAAGLGGTSIFAIVYLVFAFAMFWQGNYIYVMRNFPRTLLRWRLLIAFTIIIISLKCALQLFGCVFLDLLTEYCWIRQLFSIHCSYAKESLIFDGAREFRSHCPMKDVDAKLFFDMIAFMLLVWQLRALNSLHFQHVMLDWRAEMVLANRGAVLCNQLIEKQMKEQKRLQKDQLDAIKRRTEEIRESYAHHQITYEPRTYAEAKRAGDEYMFLTDPDDEWKLAESVSETYPGVDTAPARLEPTQVIHAAISADSLCEAADNVDRANQIRNSRLRALAAIGEPIYERDHDVEGTQSSGSSTPTMKTAAHSRSGSEQALESPTTVKGGSEREGETTSPALIRVARQIMEATLHSAASFLNKQSREYRYVGFVLNQEKERMKRQMMRELTDAQQRGADVRAAWKREGLQCVHSEDDVDRLESEADSAWRQRSLLMRFLYALSNCIIAHTDVLCYFLACVSHAYCGGAITVPLPLLVFTWGTLASPRPSKTFWVVMIAYTQFVIVVHYIFQFPFVQNKGELPDGGGAFPNDPLHLKAFRWLGLQQRDHATVFDVILLVALFFHRATVRKFGLWKDANVDSTFSVMGTPGRPAAISISDNENDTSPSHEQDSSQPCALKSSIPLSELAAATPRRLELNGPSPASTPDSSCALSRFFCQLCDPKFRYIRDLYPIMFALDIVAFLIITIFYSNFGDGSSGSFVTDIASNRVPLAFVVMLLVISSMMVVDRALYLRKWILGKLVYQLMTVVALHLWIFVVLPLMNDRPAPSNMTAQCLYLVKCVYLLVSAWQIRNGYPTLSIGNLLTHSYSLFNMVAFQTFMVVPFLFELRTAIDWTWTETSMTLFDYFNMENFYAIIYNIKCARNSEQSYPIPRGVPKTRLVKYGMGIPLIVLIVLLLWLPLLAYSLLNHLGSINLPVQAQISIGIDGFPPIYVMEAQGLDLAPVSDEFRTRLMMNFDNNYHAEHTESMTAARMAGSFVRGYSTDNVLSVKFRSGSQYFWQISDDSLSSLAFMLEFLKTNNRTVPMTISLELKRPRPTIDTEPSVHSRVQQFQLPPADVRAMIDAAMFGKGDATMTRALPLFYVVPNQGEIQLADPLINSIQAVKEPPDNDASVTFSTLQFRTLLSAGSEEGSQQQRIWFGTMNILDNTTKAILGDGFLEHVPYAASENDGAYLHVLVFVDRVFPAPIAYFVSKGVIAVYLTVVMVAGRMLRSLVMKSPLSVMIDEMPNPDRLMAIALDIYLVREAKDFILEQDLFAKMIFLFRSPTTLIRWTRLKRD